MKTWHWIALIVAALFLGVFGKWRIGTVHSLQLPNNGPTTNTAA